MTAHECEEYIEEPPQRKREALRKPERKRDFLRLKLTLPSERRTGKPPPDPLLVLCRLQIHRGSRCSTVTKIPDTTEPRLKFDTLDEWLQVIYNEYQIKIEKIKKEVNSLLYILYNIYKEKYGNDISLIKSSFTTSSSSFYKSPLQMFKNRKNVTTSSPNDTANIDRYLSVEAIPFDDNEDFEILE